MLLYYITYMEYDVQPQHKSQLSRKAKDRTNGWRMVAITKKSWN